MYDARQVGFMRRHCANIVSKYGFMKKGLHGHHWSYKDEDALDTILLTPKKHRNLHGFIELIDTVDHPDIGYYKDKSGNVLDTREKHINYFISIRKRQKEFLNNYV